MNDASKLAATLGIGAGLALVTLMYVPRPGQAEPLQWSLSQTVVEFFNRETEDRSRGGPGLSRGPDAADEDDFCIITPGRREVLWHSQPLFVMRGTVDRIQLREAQALLTQPPHPVLASDPATPDNDRLVITQFDGLALQPGTSYEWLFYDTPADEISYRVPFSVMEPGAERDQIATDLSQLQADLDQQGASAEAIAQAKAAYFLEQDMPADALHVLFAIAAPSPALITLRHETIATICSFKIGQHSPPLE